VHLTPREQERLLLATAAALARRRLERGTRIGATEAIALVCDEICEWAWDGMSIDDIASRARRLIDLDQLLPGVADLVPLIQVEALFPHGSVLVHVNQPFGPPNEAGPGAVLSSLGSIDLASGHGRRQVALTNTGDRTVWISSHFPLDQINPAIVCQPPLPGGYRLDLPSGEATTIRAGESKELEAVTFARVENDGETN